MDSVAPVERIKLVVEPFVLKGMLVGTESVNDMLGKANGELANAIVRVG